MDKFKNFVLKYKIVITIALLLVASFGIYFFVFAQEDIYADQIEVKNSIVSEIIDGTVNNDGNFDENDDPGNDSGPSNKIVRNFDSIIYNISYQLQYKESSQLEEKPTDGTRVVLVDVLIPKAIGANVVLGLSSTPEGTVPEEVTIDSVIYNYYQFDIEESTFSTNKIDMKVLDINTKNGEEIKPIIRVREKTDTSVSEITDGMTIDQIQGIDVEGVKVSAKINYGIKLYNGTVQKGNKDGSGISEFPVGIVVYLPNDDNRGMKGVEVPEELSFDLSISSSSSNSTLIYDSSNSNNTDNPTIGNYDETKYSVLNLPKSYENTNGNAGYENILINEKNTSIFKIEFKNLKYNVDTILINENEEDPKSVVYLSSKVFAFKAERNSISIKNKENIDYIISTNENNQILMEDTYVPFPGDYVTKIDFINASNITSDGSQTEPTFENSGQAKYNYNEEFYIQNTISYGYNSGDSLEKGFTNYIKIDNTAIKLVDVGNLSDETIDYYAQIKSVNENQNTSSDAYSVEYGIGEWVYTNFKIKSNAPSYCPTNLSKLSKEQLMNYYGGPCIEGNENIKWYNSIEEAAAVDENNRNKIIIFKFNFEDELYTETKAIIRLKAQVVNNINNIGRSFEIVSRGETVWNQGDGEKPYYLSETPRKSVSDQSSDLYYVKTEYDSSYNPIDQTNIPNDKYGNTIFVTPFKAFFNETIVKDKYDSIKNTIYLGATDPMEIIINPVIYKSDMNATITNATISVYLPNNLEIYLKPGDKVYSSKNQILIDNILYNVYNYEYTEDDIKYENNSAAGTIENLIVHAYISIDTKDNTSAQIKSTIDATLKPNIDAITTFNAKTSIDARTTSKTIILKNNQEISSIGKVDKTYIEENDSFNYTMRAANLTGKETNLEFLKILPYAGDDLSKGSSFEGTLSTSIVGNLPDGYEAYYTTDNSKSIYNNEISTSSTTKWTKWDNYNSAVNATAVLIKSNNKIADGSYFAGQNGVTINIKTRGNKESDVYYNNFYILNKDDSSVTSSSSNISSVSVYNRKISGYAFEDSNYDGFYTTDEVRLKDIIVELYKVNNPNYSTSQSKDPLSVINNENTQVEKISDGITDKKGAYSFEGLSSGNYYVKYEFNCDKYTVTEKNKQDPTTQGDTALKDSDAVIVEKVDEEGKDICYAVSNIITLNNSTVESKNIDIGLRIRKNFDIKISKYITNVTVNSNKGTQSYDYNNENKVKIDVKNLKNTTFRVTYGFEIENSKYFPGTIGNIVETIPEGMTFDSTLPENDGWIESDGNLYYTNLNRTLILPGEKYHMTIVLDLRTDSGGDYVNFVVANNLSIMPTTTNFLESIEIDRTEEIEDTDEYSNSKEVEE